MKKDWLVLGAVLLVFLITRFWQIGNIPASVYWDEASIGYNAFSVAESGKDEWGDFFPLHFRAFGEFKLPVYIYFTAISVFLFGLDVFSVRLPAVVFGAITVFLIFIFVRQVFQDRRLAIFTSMFLCFSQWFFIFSRTGYEATAGLMFYLLGLICYFKSRERLFYLLLGSIFFVVSAYSYNSFRIVAPLSVLVLLFYLKFYQNFRSRYFIISVIFFSVLSIPILRLYFLDFGVSRYTAVGVEGNFIVELLKNYVKHFSLDFLILKGDANPRSQLPGAGQLSIIEFGLFVGGLIGLFTKYKKYWFLMVLFIISFIPAVITKESPHALRSIGAVVFISIFAALGIDWYASFFKKKLWKNVATFGIVAMFCISFFSYYYGFLENMNKLSSKDWQYGYMQLYKKYSQTFDDYKKVLISDYYGQPYVFYLFYNKINPGLFRQNVVYNTADKWGFSTVANVGKIKFGKVEDEVFKDESYILFLAKEEKLVDQKERDIIRFENGDIAFYVYARK